MVDASVMISAGSSSAPLSANCRNLLDLIHANNHSIATCNKLKHEIEVRPGERGFGRPAIAMHFLAMMKRKSRLTHINIDAIETEINGIIDNHTEFSSAEKILTKDDSHLISLSICSENKILARDEQVRTLFSKLARTCSRIRTIHWDDPEKFPDRCFTWIINGAFVQSGQFLENWSD